MVPLVADRFVKVCTILEAAVRAITTAVNSRQRITLTPFEPCLVKLLLGSSDSGDDGPELAKNIGLRGPARQAVELQHYYSVLSTVEKLARCEPWAGHGISWEQGVANTCCWASAMAATSAPAARLGAAAVAAPTVGEQAQVIPAEASIQSVEQQPEGVYLPSLVIFGRCCLVWAEHLKQQTPKLLLLLASGTAVPASGTAVPASGTAVQEQEQGECEHAVELPCSAARICVAQWDEGPADATTDPCSLDQLVATVASWVGAITSPATLVALAAAAGGDSQLFKQQLEALSAAQRAMRKDGVSEASLAALVQQLQATGVMLSSVAVPHFCNNPACVNISGPTELQQVSGRSCICAGCRTARYCGRECQRQAWRQHKPVCKALAAAAARGGTD